MNDFEIFCGSELWNSSVIYNDDPDFTPCFQNSFIKWIPCFILWLISPFWIFGIYNNKKSNLKYSLLSFLKFTSIGLILMLEFSSLILNIYERTTLNNTQITDVYFVTPNIMIISYVLIVCIIHIEIRNNVKTSMPQFLFWGLLSLLSILLTRSVSIKFEKQGKKDSLQFSLYIVYFVLILFNFFLTFFCEKSNISKKQNKQYPENNVSLLSKLTFWWLNGVIWNGYKRNLGIDDMWNLDENESCEYLTLTLEKKFKETLKKYQTNLKTYKSYYFNSKVENHNSELKENSEIVYNYMKKPLLGLCITKTFYKQFLVGSFLKLIEVLMATTAPIILDLIISFTIDRNQKDIVGYFYAILLLIALLTQSFMSQHYQHLMFLLGTRVRTAVMGLIYKKSLKLSTISRRKINIGEMTNLMQSDAQSFIDLTTNLNMIWSSPLQVIFAMLLLWNLLGAAAFVGLGVMLLLIPINIFCSNKFGKHTVGKIQLQDSRTGKINEIITGIKVIKFYGWELSLQNLVNKIRNDELKTLFHSVLYFITLNFSWAFVTFIVSLTTFITFIYTNTDKEFNSRIVFVSLSFFGMIRLPLYLFPMVVSSLVQGKLSLKRINDFLLMDEINENQITNDCVDDFVISCENANLTWNPEKNEFSLKNLNFHVRNGQLIGIVGKVGSGKSSLLYSLLGDMHKLMGTIKVNGSIAYVSQQAWIQNATVKDNILFGKPYIEELYKNVMFACALETDFKLLIAGDQTEIGEKGINLSGGQKQRISLARAVYNDADIYILDDPLSAVDAHVGKHIFENVIGPNGILKNKTRIFVTNSIKFLSDCDAIMMIESGSIIEVGSYDKLRKKNGPFSEFTKAYIENVDEKNDKIETINKKKEKTIDEEEITINSKKENSDEKKIIKVEEIDSENVKLSIVIYFIKACSVLVTLLFIFCFVSLHALQVGGGLWLSRWTDSIIKNTNDAISTSAGIGIYTAIGATQQLFSLVGHLIFVKMLMKCSKYLHDLLFNSILRSKMQFIESTPLSRIINRFSKDMSSAEFQVPVSMKDVIYCTFDLLAIVILISIATPLFLVSLVPLFIIYLFCQKIFLKPCSQIKRLEMSSRTPIFSHFGETQQGITTIRAYKSQNRLMNILYNKIDYNNSFNYPSYVSQRWLGLRLEFIGSLLAFFATFFAIIARNTITPGLTGLSISFSLNVSVQLTYLGNMLANFVSNLTSIERIKEYCEIEPEADWINGTKNPPADWPNKGTILFDNYSLKYRDDLDCALKNINCIIKPSEKVGIIGRTGAGKSSLTLGLFRILESFQGRIIIDGIDIKEIGLHHIRQKITIIPQEPFIFSGTLRLNLDPFVEYSDDDIWSALERVSLKNYVEKLDNKLLFQCTEGGDNISVGQKQLICLARALLRKSKILVLDEATAAIDHNTDEFIQKTIRTSFSNCTILTIAHRLNTILDNDRIMVFDKGELVENDTPNNLFENKNSIFYSMASSAGVTKDQISPLENNTSF